MPNGFCFASEPLCSLSTNVMPLFLQEHKAVSTHVSVYIVCTQVWKQSLPLSHQVLSTQFLSYWAVWQLLWKPLCAKDCGIHIIRPVFMYYGLCPLLGCYLSPSPKGMGEGNSVLLSVWRHWFPEREQKFILDLQTLVQHLDHLLHIQNIGKFMPSAWKHLHHVPPLKAESLTHGPCRESEGRQPSRGVCFALLRFYVSGDTTKANITNSEYHLSISIKNWNWK